jgi:integrase
VSAATLAARCAALVAEKRAIGYKYESEESVLRRFESFCSARFPGLATITRESAEAWIEDARARGVKPATAQSLAGPIRELARHLGRLGVDAYVLPGKVTPAPDRYVPHIYTDKELAQIFAQTDQCRPCAEVPHRHLVMPVLFRLIYGCALRVSEARLLRPSDVDTELGVVTIWGAKGGKDRQVPVAESLRARLDAYRLQVHWDTSLEWFFPGRPGLGLTVGNIEKNFRRFLWQAGISHGGRGKGPRVHDLRHAAAVNNLRRWFQAGEDVQALLPVLQTYLGHSSLSDVAYYLRLTAESYPDLTARTQVATGQIIPPVWEEARHAD